MREIAALPNVVCKLSGVVTEAYADWTPAQLMPYLAHAIECFGFDRLMYGSDWPVSERTHRIADWVNLIEQAIAGCGEHETRALFRDTAARFYRIDLPGADPTGATTLSPTIR